MKRSVNFSSPRKYALAAMMRQSSGESWLAEMSDDTAKRVARDVQTLRDAGCIDLLCSLEVMATQVTKKEPHQNIGDFLYQGYDGGVRARPFGKFTMPDGTTRNTPTLSWYWAMYAIEVAEQKRSQK